MKHRRSTNHSLDERSPAFYPYDTLTVDGTTSRPRMPIDDFARRRHASVARHRRIGGLELPESSAPGQRMPPPRVHIDGAERSQVAHHAVDIRIGERETFDVHNRVDESGTYQKVTKIVHIDEGVHVRVAIDDAP